MSLSPVNSSYQFLESLYSKISHETSRATKFVRKNSLAISTISVIGIIGAWMIISLGNKNSTLLKDVQDLTDENENLIKNILKKPNEWTINSKN